ncbi:MAG TPA: hypothetical protein VF892_11315 [Pseudonocardiaceae bacterium]
MVQIATRYARQIAATLQTLLASSQNLVGLVQSVLSGVTAAEQLITQFTVHVGAAR